MHTYIYTCIILNNNYYGRLSCSFLKVFFYHSPSVYRAQENPKYKNGEWDERAVFENFLKNFDSPTNPDAKVSLSWLFNDHTHTYTVHNIMQCSMHALPQLCMADVRTRATDLCMHVYEYFILVF